ncbi:4-alpha-glucanotransferase [uncultured Clostridium sp.]|jgi:4-alpha-glucanotransferase|uniref:4-alpha-glucanotransferase n=1 Tax=uncultured Clostridium sp. TaxID=59620 RepID=UPI00261F0180|nr:4-alpha-glucanotransferase [uncultured Clostridium sp.]
MEASNVTVMGNEVLSKAYMIRNFGEEAYKKADEIKSLNVDCYEINIFTGMLDERSLHKEIVDFVGNPAFIDLSLLRNDKLLSKNDYKDIEVGNNQDRKRILKLAYKNSKGILDFKLQEFMLEQMEWLDDYSLYMSAREFIKVDSFDEWKIYKGNHPENVDKIRNDFEEEINYQIFVQYEFHKQWRNLKNYFGDLGIKAKRVLKVF